MIKELRLLREMESLVGNGSQKAKQKIISDNITESLSYLLNICFNPFITTKLNKIKFNDEISEVNHNQWAIFVDLLEELKCAPAANDTLRIRANNLISTRISDDPLEDIELRTILMKVITKSMNIGIGAKLINKALGNELIPDPSVMLATDNRETIEKWSRIYCEEKYDGVRVIALLKNGEFTYFTRAFNELDASRLSRITFALKTAIINSGKSIIGDWFFDGELTDLNRKSVSGKVTQILRGTADKDIDENMLFNVFDFEEAVTLSIGTGVIEYVDRRATLEKILSFLPEESHVVLGKMWELESADGIAEIYQRIVNEGGEGVICKDNSVYECKRSKSWVKIKEISECDLEVIGWYPGEGKRTGFIGGFICTDASKTVNVKVGSGFTDEDLKSLSISPDDNIGKIIAVLYNVVIEDKHKNRSLFLPRYVVTRFDKDSPDDLSNKY
jgi:DNA ligase-1